MIFGLIPNLGVAKDMAQACAERDACVWSVYVDLLYGFHIQPEYEEPRRGWKRLWATDAKCRCS